MKPIAEGMRRVANIHAAEYEPWEGADHQGPGSAILQLNKSKPLGVGFHVYRMEPGARTDAHEHMGDEEILILEGELVENDGTVYRPGDLVWLGKGTEHSSYAPNGCLMAVYIETAERDLDKE